MNGLNDEYKKLESSPETRRLLRQEELILEITEMLAGLLQREGVTKTELSQRIGKTKGFVSQILAGGRNLTLRTIADVVDALGYELEVRPQKRDTNRKNVTYEMVLTDVYGKILPWKYPSKLTIHTTPSIGGSPLAWIPMLVF